MFLSIGKFTKIYLLHSYHMHAIPLNTAWKLNWFRAVRFQTKLELKNIFKLDSVIKIYCLDFGFFHVTPLPLPQDQVQANVCFAASYSNQIFEKPEENLLPAYSLPNLPVYLKRSPFPAIFLSKTTLSNDIALNQIIFKLLEGVFLSFISYFVYFDVVLVLL